MPRLHGGHTELGNQLNKTSQKTDHVDVSRTNTKKAIIYKSYKNRYVFYMKLLNKKGQLVGKTGPIPLVGTPNELSLRYGTPEEMENEWMVIITYRGTTINRGTAQVIGKIGTALGGDTTEVEQSNQLQVKGTAFAPPGPGM